ncbi:MAG: DUF5658 family protein [Thermodesulfobacteriota bacterium]
MESERRVLKDRRKKPTPILSRYTFWGRRKEFRRKTDQERGGYVDRYSPGILFFMTLIIGLNILDAIFTTMILDLGGYELNPIVRSVIFLYGDNFWLWKFGVVSASLILLCLHSKFRMVKPIIFGITLIYIAVISYQLQLIIDRLPPEYELRIGSAHSITSAD